jgi:hypothetical protein
MHARRRLVGSAVVAPLLVACGNSSTGGSDASCVGPYLDDQPSSGRYGAPAPTASPLAPVHLTLMLPGGQSVPLGEFTAHGQDLGFNAEVHIPPGTCAGTATIRDDQRYPKTYRFKVGATK